MPHKKMKIHIALSITTLLTLLSMPVSAEKSDPAVRDISTIEITQQQLLSAVASRTLTWLTGSASNNDHMSVGRVANYFGFVGLRVASGHSLKRSDVAKDTLAVLNESQRDVLIEILEEQKSLIEDAHVARFKMNRALEGLLIGEKITQNDFRKLGEAYGASEARVGQMVAQKLGDVAQTLTPEQSESMNQIRSKHISGQGHTIQREKLKLKVSREEKQDLENIAARFLSWKTGTQTYNDFEVVGKPSQHFGFVSLRLDSNHSVKRGGVAKEVLQILTPQQRQLLEDAAAGNLKQFGDFIEARAQLMRALEVALAGSKIDAVKVSKLGAAIGAVEANMTWEQATAMLQLKSSMSDKQTLTLLEMRDKYIASAATLSADPVERGRQLFAQCTLCHDANGNRAAGPSLEGIVGRDIATDGLYDNYSSAMQTFAESRKVWSEILIDEFLSSPRTLVPGTYMGFNGLNDPQDRAALISYLNNVDPGSSSTK